MSVRDNQGLGAETHLRPGQSNNAIATQGAAQRFAGSTPVVFDYPGQTLEDYYGSRAAADFAEVPWYTSAIGSIVSGALTAGIAAPIGAAAGGGLGGSIAGGAAAGAAGGGVNAAFMGQDIGKGALAGGVTGGLGAGVANQLAPGVSNVTGLGPTASKGLTGAALGAGKAALTGGNVLGGAVSGGVSAAAGGALKDAGAGSFASGIGGKVAGGIAGAAVTSSGASHSPGVAPASSPAGGQSVANTPQQVGVAGPAEVGAAPGSSSGGGFVSNLLGGVGASLGLDPSNIGGSLGSTLGSVAPYAGVAAIGINQADKGRAQDQKYIDQLTALGKPYNDAGTSLLKNAQAGKLSTADQGVVNTEKQQGQQLIDSTAGLSKIAQSAFSDYSAGKLPQADELKLQQQVQAQKQQVRQQLASAGITDSTILAGQDQQIDNQASIMRQDLLDKRFATGNQAYDQWLKGTTAGQQTIQDGMKFASAALDNMMKNSLSFGALGMGATQAAIQQAMQTDQAYAAQVSELLGTLTSAYAYQVAKRNSSSGAAGGGSGGMGAPKVGGSAGGAAGGGNPVSNSDEHNQLLTNDRGALQNELGSNAGFDNSLGDSFNSGLSDYFGGQDSPVSGWLSADQLGG